MERIFSALLIPQSTALCNFFLIFYEFFFQANVGVNVHESFWESNFSQVVPSRPDKIIKEIFLQIFDPASVRVDFPQALFK